ncbi:MAG TPA: acetyl-CoA carboxylase carboxyltransferase subunit alpha, partial [Blastocatellia bacterium]|nr:acetyl-CoA carboxylase carboxyltransferase subunit alpha [Blastocatellia bacterium]
MDTKNRADSKNPKGSEKHESSGYSMDEIHRRLQESERANLTADPAATSPWERVRLARHPDRPQPLDYINLLITNFMELHGDRRFGDDPAVIAGVGWFNEQPCAVVGTQKGHTTKERQSRNFGYPNPEGYRKALRVMKFAEKFRRPIFTLIDTAGAYPGVDAEERGQAEAIAYNLREMARLKVPVIVTVTGEGGSGGALAIGVGDIVLMLENSIYSVISPEGCSSILWHDTDHVEQAARALRITAEDLLQFGLIDQIIPEPPGGAHTNQEDAASTLSAYLSRALSSIQDLNEDERIERRYQRLRAIGEFEDTQGIRTAGH